MQGAFSKDESSSYLRDAVNASKGIPGPGSYNDSMSWTASHGKFVGVAKRKFFTDEAAE